MYGATKAILTVSSSDQTFVLFDGSSVDVGADDLVFLIKSTVVETNLDVFFDCVVPSFSDNIFNYTKVILNSNFSLLLAPDRNSFVFTSSSDFTYCNFIIEASAMSELPSTPEPIIIDNGDSTPSSNSGFSVPSLNGNCGSLLDGTEVTVTGLEGDFNVVASQFVWNDSTAQMSMIMYNLSKDGKFCLVPDVYVSAKAS